MSVLQSELQKQTSSNGSSQGGTRSGVPYSSAKGAFWPNVSDANRIAGITMTRKWFLYNDAAIDALISPSIWIVQEPTYCDRFIGLGFDDSDDDDAAQGNMTAWSANAVAALVSTDVDTRDVIIYGLDAAGDPQQEGVTLDDISEVLSTTIWSVVYGLWAGGTNTTTVTVKQGAGGTVRGTIGPGAVSCFLWMTPLNKGAGIHLEDLPSGDSIGIWDRIVVPAGVSGVRPNNSVTGVEEN